VPERTISSTLNQERLRRLSVEKASEVRIVSAHHAVEFEVCAAGRPL